MPLTVECESAECLLGPFIYLPRYTEQRMTSKTFKTKIIRDGSMCLIPLPFDPKTVFGKVRAPVKVTLNGC